MSHVSTQRPTKFLLLEGNDTPHASDKIEVTKKSIKDTIGKQHFDGKYYVYKNGKHLLVNISDKYINQSIVSNEKRMDSIVWSEAIKNPNLDINYDQLSESLSQLSHDKENVRC